MELEVERRAKQRDCAAASRLVQAEVADLDKAAGQDVLKEAAEELLVGESAGAPEAVLALAITERHGVVVEGDD
jgi:hypothetical protein